MTFPRRVMVLLPGDSRVSGEARAFTRLTLRDWGLESAVDDALLIVSELTGNSYRHGLPPYHLALEHMDHVLEIEVQDAGSGAPVVLASDSDQEWGRGMTIVTTLAETVHSEPFGAGDGKTVTATLRV